MDNQLVGLEELVAMKEYKEKRDQDKIDKMTEAITKVGILQEKSYRNSEK